MSGLWKKLLGAADVVQQAYVDEVFGVHTYTGNGATQALNAGIDLSGKGGMAWIKGRSGTYGGSDHYLFDTDRGADIFASSNTTTGQGAFSAGSGVSFNSSGISIGASAILNDSATNYLALMFRKHGRFFDAVVYVGDGTSGRNISHGLSMAPGVVISKSISGAGDWNVFHRSASGDLKLNLASAQSGSKSVIAAVDAGTFTVSGSANTNGVTYIAYVFAHDSSVDGLIQCGSYTGNGSTTGPQINLGWEPQFVLVKRVDVSGFGWYVHDAARRFTVSGSNALEANSSASDADYGASISPNATGFAANTTQGGYNASGGVYIYVAIRRPNKPPMSGAQIYNASTASGVVNAGFPVDLHIGATRSGAATNHAVHARLVGGAKELITSSTAAEATITDLGFDSMTGLRSSLASGGINHFFRRAPGAFDVVCDAGTGAARAVFHSLGVAPELVIRKGRSGGTQWEVWHAALSAGEKLVLNSTAAKTTDAVAWNSTLPSSANFTVGSGANVNTSGATYVSYLFATSPGISKVGSYTGNGTSQTINCGFATGARFILIKRTDAAGDWYVWDSVRGIVAANDPHLSLNTTAAEVTTDDSIDPDVSGFVVNQVAATNVNVSGGSYIFLAIA